VGLTDDLGPGPLGLDTAIFVYYIEEHPRYLSLVEPVFEGIDRGRWRAVTSGVTLLETLVVPYRIGDDALADRYEALLTRSRGLTLVDLGPPAPPGDCPPAGECRRPDARCPAARRGAGGPLHRLPDERPGAAAHHRSSRPPAPRLCLSSLSR